jgi:splicing suppressor protein 51
LKRDEDFLMVQYQRTNNNVKNFVILCTDDPKTKYVPLSSARNWFDFYTVLSDKSDMAPKVSEKLEPLMRDEMTNGLAALMRAGTGTMTMPLTIIAALEKTLPNLSTKTSIHLHILGAAAREFGATMVFEEMLHQLPALKHLRITCVGYDIPRELAKEWPPGKTLEVQCCSDCKSAGRRRTLDLWQGGYHEYLQTGWYQKPDLAVSFHSGFSQESQTDWLPTIQHLSQATHASLFTCYNETEMREETGMLESMFGAKFLQRGEINKWRGVCPILEVMEKSENSVYYLNNYWYIVAGKNG